MKLISRPALTTALAILLTACGANIPNPLAPTSTPIDSITTSPNGIDTSTPSVNPTETTTPTTAAAPDLPVMAGYIVVSEEGPGTSSEIYVIHSSGNNLTHIVSEPFVISWPSWSPDGTRIVFRSTRDGNSEIYVVNADGSNPINLTHNSREDITPVWSPDASRIAFVSTNPGEDTFALYVINADGSNEIKLASDSALSYLVWSPDSRTIYYAARPGNIVAANADGSGQSHLTDTGLDFDPAVSPDGTKIAFWSTRDGRAQVYVMNADGTGLINLSNNLVADDGSPAWSPDGSRIAFHSNRDGSLADIFIMNADGTGITNLTQSPDTNDASTKWSPDGSQIAYVSSSTGEVEIVVMDLDGSGHFNLTRRLRSANYFEWNPVPPTGEPVFPTSIPVPTAVGAEVGRIAFSGRFDGIDDEIAAINADGTNLVNLTHSPGTDNNPIWSPDGTRILFESARDGGGQFVMNSDGSGVVKILNSSDAGFHSAWSPDGTRIAFHLARDGSYEIFVVNADGSSDPVNLTNSPEDDTQPVWSPDGTRIAFRRQNSQHEQFEAYVMNVDGSGQLNLSNNVGFDGPPAWSPDGTRIAFPSQRDGNTEIYLVNPDGSNLTRLTNNLLDETAVFWSPDGKQIGFTAGLMEESEAYVMNSDGTDERQLLDLEGVEVFGGWSPDSLRVVIVAAVFAPGGGSADIYVVGVKGGSPILLTSDLYGVSDPNWQPQP